MRHAYVADVGDFGKYGLLRALHRKRPACRLGVVWYLTDTEERNNDGRHDGYLRGAPSKCSHFRDCDPDLYDRLATIRRNRRLSVRLIESKSILPTTTRFYRRVVPGRSKKVVGSAFWTARTKWLEGACDSVRDADLVFLDPDNGIVFRDDPNIRENGGRKLSHKHAYWHELESLLCDGKSVVAYHHLGRQRGGHHLQIQTCLQTIRARGYRAFGIHYRRGSARVFFVIPPNAEARKWLLDACRQFATSWSAHCRFAQLEVDSSRR